MKTIIIYVLLLESNKYYVGKTNNIFTRLDNHINKLGSEWTKKYNLLKLINIYENCDPYDENKYTLKTMSKYGIDNVRGGSFSKIILSDEMKTMINLMINGAEDKCFQCGKSGHLVSNCLVTKNEPKYQIQKLQKQQIRQQMQELQKQHLHENKFRCIIDLLSNHKFSSDIDSDSSGISKINMVYDIFDGQIKPNINIQNSKHIWFAINRH